MVPLLGSLSRSQSKQSPENSCKQAMRKGVQAEAMIFRECQARDRLSQEVSLQTSNWPLWAEYLR